MGNIDKYDSPGIKLFIPRGCHHSNDDFICQVNCDLLTNCLILDEVAALLCCSVKTLRNWIYEGLDFPPHFKIGCGKERFFPKVWFNAWLISRPKIHRLK